MMQSMLDMASSEIIGGLCKSNVTLKSTKRGYRARTSALWQKSSLSSGGKVLENAPCGTQASLNFFQRGVLHSKQEKLYSRHERNVSANIFGDGGGDIVEVESLKGIRAVQTEDGRPMVEYLVGWKDGSPDTWEPATNLADNLLRDFEQKWWSSVRKADIETIESMLEKGAAVLARTVDDGRRSALHFAAALGKPELIRLLLNAGAEVDLADKDGYTPLHMAAGYLHTSSITELLAAGADPEQKDRQGRSPLELVESLKAALPADNPMTVARRVALEDVLKVLTDNLFEDVEPEAVLEVRNIEDSDSEQEYLIKFYDVEEPVWLHEKYVSEEVIEDFTNALEYYEAEEIIGVRNRGDSRTYLVRWKDDYPDSWEPEEHVSSDLVRLFEEKQAPSHASMTNGAISVPEQRTEDMLSV